MRSGIELSELEERLRLLYICGDLADERSMDRLEGLIESGVTSVQLRVKYADGFDLYRSAVVMTEFCRRRGTLFFVNDRLDIAMASGADGVHLGNSDLPISAARRIAPPMFIIGATAREPETAFMVQAEGADYIGSGAAFVSSTKPDAKLIGPVGISRVTRLVSIPVIGISGIRADNMTHLSGLGLSGVAVSASLAGKNGMSEAKKISDYIRGGILS